MPKVYSAQAAGCAPVVHAMHRGTDLIEPVKPDTIAKSIAIGNPADGYYVLKACRESGGWAEAATDEEIVSAIHLLAHRGHLHRARRRHHRRRHQEAHRAGAHPRDESIVINVTGNGYGRSRRQRHVAAPFTINAPAGVRPPFGRSPRKRPRRRRRLTPFTQEDLACLQSPHSHPAAPLHRRRGGSRRRRRTVGAVVSDLERQFAGIGAPV
jgi:hypothetical protein